MSHLRAVRPLALASKPREGDGDALSVLTSRALEGQTDAMGELLRAVLPSVRAACRALLGPSHPDLDDAVQGALIAIHRALPSYRFECSILHYAVRITFRTTHGYRRRLRLFADRFRLTADGEAVEGVRAPRPADAAVLAERSEALRGVMAKLPHAQAEALLLHVALEYSLAEVAAICAVPENTIKTRLRLGKDALRRRVGRNPILNSLFGEES